MKSDIQRTGQLTLIKLHTENVTDSPHDTTTNFNITLILKFQNNVTFDSKMSECIALCST